MYRHAWTKVGLREPLAQKAAIGRESLQMHSGHTLMASHLLPNVRRQSRARHWAPKIVFSFFLHFLMTKCVNVRQVGQLKDSGRKSRVLRVHHSLTDSNLHR